jgi:cytoskeletal protein CcmA (bactofilin family)
MAIFNSSSGSTNTPSATTIIADGTEIKGDIQLKCNLLIDGKVEGAVQAIGNVVIGNSGIAMGDIQASRVSISGRLEGSIDADVVEILEGGKFFGKVTSKEFVIESRGVFEGESRLKVEHAHESVEDSVNASEADTMLEKRDNKLTAV